MRQSEFTILGNEHLTADVLRMRLQGDTSSITQPGQFVELSVPGFFLRRPISVCDKEEDLLVLVYKVVGNGTDRMSRMQPGEKIDVLSGLGNGFSMPDGLRKVLLIGGGVGVPPLYLLAKKWISRGVVPTVILGFNNKSEIILRDDFEKLGCPVSISTADGTEGIRGFVTDVLPSLNSDPELYQACGPLPMLRALSESLGDVPGELSLEERMGCGFGACMGCSIHTKSGSARVCTEGPVFASEVIEW